MLENVYAGQENGACVNINYQSLPLSSEILLGVEKLLRQSKDSSLDYESINVRVMQQRI